MAAESIGPVPAKQGFNAAIPKEKPGGPDQEELDKPTDNTEQLRNDDKRNAEILARIPAGRWGIPADLAGAVVFLASDAAAYVSGQVICVDGGAAVGTMQVRPPGPA